MPLTIREAAESVGLSRQALMTAMWLHLPDMQSRDSDGSHNVVLEAL